ncbi:MAG: hypothetical protein Q7T33_01070 [Dehalococcoidia bacterium]|nr:hypothetical protein [Dehalococcoidia bacterium]
MANVQAEASGLPHGESALEFSFQVKGIASLLLLGLLLRLVLATLPGFSVDIGTFSAWANDLALNGPWDFYRADYFTDYAPGYMYVLLFIGKLNQEFHLSPGQMEYVLKLPSIAADLASAYLLYKLLAGKKMEVRLGAAALYLLFPASLLIGAIWGQVDSLLALFLLLSVYFIGRDRPVAGAVAYTVGFLMKPQAIAALPFLALWIIRERWPNWSDERSTRQALLLWLKCAAAGFGTLLVLITPFFELEPWRLIEVLYNATNVQNYRVNSFFAYNFWNMGGLFDWGFKCDVGLGDCASDAHNTVFLGVVTRFWGLAMFAAGLAAVLLVLRRAQGMGMLALGTALSVLVFYLFLTRMHERYVFAFFLPFLAACALLESRALWAAFAGLSALHFANLYHVFIAYYPNDGTGGIGAGPDLGPSLKVGGIYKWFEKGDFFGVSLPLLGRLATVQVLSILMVAAFFLLLATAYVLESRRRRQAAPA